MSMASSRRWASFISGVASSLYFFIILFQVPLFRVQCRIGICKSPIEMACSQLVATEIFPAFVDKALIYPGVIAKSYFHNTTIPNYHDLLKQHNFTDLRKASAATSDLHHLEIFAGCYLSVAGAILGLLRQGRMGLFGSLLIIWGFVREAIPGNSADMNTPMKTIHIYPLMSVAVLCAFLSIRKDVRKLIRCCKPRRVSKSVRFRLKDM